VDAPLPARLPLEVFHHIRDVDAPAIDAGLDERAIEELPRRADEGVAGEVLVVAWLLADHDEVSVGGAFAEDGLGSGLVEGTGGAALGAGAELVQVGEVRSTSGPTLCAAPRRAKRAALA